MLFIRATVSSGSKTFVSSFLIRPSIRSTGGWPTVMCRSLALRLTTVCSSLSMRNVPMIRPSGSRGRDRESGERSPFRSLFRPFQPLKRTLPVVIIQLLRNSQKNR